jgi:hypothetical protein
VEAQVLDVEHREVEGLEDRAHLRQRRRLTAREDVLLDPRVQPRRRDAADGVDEAAPVRRQDAIDERAEQLRSCRRRRARACRPT